MAIRILEGDCRDRLRELPDGSVNTCVTSPPYFGLRDYGHEGQMGLEPTPDEFVSGMVEVFREVRRVLRDDGTLWLNIGDSYAGSWGNYGGQNRGKGDGQREINSGSLIDNPAYHGTERLRPPTSNKIEGVKPKDLIGIPWMLAFALRADGWYLRQDIIWSKPNPMPESVRDRCTKAHEYLFLLSKGPRYYFDAEAIAESSVKFANEGPRGRTKQDGEGYDDAKARGFGNQCQVTETRNKRSVWEVTTQPFKGAHFATFPPALIEPCIKAGCPEGGTVLDPFFGAGTTGLVADRLGRDCIGIELNPEYAEIARNRLIGDAGMFAEIAA